MEDVVEVGSRVSWGAILAGAVMALAVSFVLTLLGSAIGFSASDAVSNNTLAWGSGIWAILAMVVALFIGGWITSQCVVGETKTESVVHGVIMWGVTFAMVMWFATAGISTGLSGMMQTANVASNVSQENWQQFARAAGVPADQLETWTAQASATARDPQQQAEAREQAQETATYASWWTLAGTVLSMIAAVGGALAGAGPTFRLLPLHGSFRHFSTSSHAMPRGA